MNVYKWLNREGISCANFSCIVYKCFAYKKEMKKKHRVSFSFQLVYNRVIVQLSTVIDTTFSSDRL